MNDDERCEVLSESTRRPFRQYPEWGLSEEDDGVLQGGDGVECPALADVVHLLLRACEGLPDAETSKPLKGLGDNAGQAFINDTFEVREYCWCEGSYHGTDAEGIPLCPPNFVFKAPRRPPAARVALRWYKRAGRDDEASREVSPAEAAQVLAECLASIAQAG